MELEQETEVLIAEDGVLPALIDACMATAGTGTRVFGVETQTEVEDSRYGQCTEDLENRSKGCATWERPVDDLFWSIFTTPGLLSAVFSVTREATEAASHWLHQRANLSVTFQNTAPLALALYGNDLNDVLEREAGCEGHWKLGMILRES